MAKEFPRINLKAATITGAVVGFLCWLLVAPFMASGSGYGWMWSMMGYNGTSAYGGAYPFHMFSAYSIVVDIIFSAAIGAAIALVYNWALALK